MKVKELIEKLSKLDPDAVVCIDTSTAYVYCEALEIKDITQPESLWYIDINLNEVNSDIVIIY